MLDEKADPVKLSLEGNMKFLREKLRKRRDLLCSEIANHLVPLGCSMVTYPRGGYFLWLRLPQGINRRFLQATMAKHPDKERLIVGWGNLFGVPDTENFDQHRFGDHIRLCFAYLHVEELTRGIKHLADFISLTQGAIAKIK
ncbi:hypothetical protein BX666DRAFT_1978243 [Dichotomocladium elegans]|nr:hypothetical protein BX666DRAFT_1978243 [Dichotomocladium elegans]